MLGTALLSVTLWAAPPTDLPATPAAGRINAPVVAIEVQPAPGRTAAHYRGMIKQPLGKPPDPELIRQSLRTLFATGEFAGIKAAAYPATVNGRTGVRLLFATKPNYFISLVRVNHSPDPPADTELEDASGLDVGAVYEPAELGAAAAKIRDRLRAYGFYGARISAAATLDHATAGAAVRIDIQPGPIARLGEIALSGAAPALAQQLLRASHLKPGSAYSRPAIDAAAAAMQAFFAKRGRLTAGVAVSAADFRPKANRLDITFKVSPGPIVTVAVEGMKISGNVLREQLPVYQEHAADLALIEEGRSNLVNYLQSKGYFEAQVDYRRIRVNEDALRILYTVQPGPRERLDHISFSGNHYFDADDLLEHVTIRPASPWPGVIPGARGEFSSAQADRDAAALAQLYQLNGFAAVRVYPEIGRSQHGRVAVNFDIVEGPQTRIRNLSLIGASPRNRAALAQLLTSARGQPYAAASVAADRNTILTYYYNAGYQDATCEATTAAVGAPGAGEKSTPDPDPTPRGASREDVTFTIHEGRLQTVHRVLIAGQRYVHRNVIAHDIELAPGRPLSQSAMFDTQRRLYDSGLFTSATVVARNPKGSESAKDVLVTVHEAKRYTFSEGVGLQVQSGTGGRANLGDVLGHTGYSPLFSFEATRTAMTGRAQTLSFRAAYGTLQKRAVLGYDMPDAFNDKNLRAELTAFYDDTYDIRTFRAIREQAGLSLQQGLTPASGFGYDASYRRVRVLSPLVAPQEIPVLSQPVQVAEISASYHRDHRDDPLESHRGTYNSFGAGVARTFGDGFANFGRLDWQNRWYTPLGGEGSVVLAGSTQIGIEIPFGHKEQLTLTDPITGAQATTHDYVLPLPERYLSGGADSLRGYSINQAGPRDPITGFPVGGDALLVENLELRFPLIGPSIGGVAFYDLGNVYSTPTQMVQSLFRWRPPSESVTGSAVLTANSDFTSHTVGAGLRYRTPVGPVRLDFGYLLNAPTFSYFSAGAHPEVLNQSLPHFHFFFSIGQTF